MDKDINAVGMVSAIERQLLASKHENLSMESMAKIQTWVSTSKIVETAMVVVGIQEDPEAIRRHVLAVTA
jgi:hypothetical protein